MGMKHDRFSPIANLLLITFIVLRSVLNCIEPKVDADLKQSVVSGEAS